MAQFINTKKEQFLGFDFFKKHYLPPKEEFDYRKYKRSISDFYASYGFEVSMVYANYFSRMRIPEFSDKYLSDDVYYFYVLPTVNRYDFINAYMDKNGYDRLFPKVDKPATIIKNINGHYYNSIGEEIAFDEAVKIVSSSEKDLIIKPSIETGGGVGFGILPAYYKNEKIEEEFITRKYDFIVQERLEQCSLFSQLNPTSLNTIRINTYRTLRDGIVILCSFVRMGGAGSVIDNASGGGSFCHIHEDGMLDDIIMRYKTFKKTTFEEFKGIKPFRIPNYNKIITLIKELHNSLPYFDVVGWDIALDKEERPVFIEMNLTPQSGGTQMSNGPMFGSYIEEVMNRTIQIKKEEDLYMKLKAPNGSYKLLQL